MTKAQPIFHFSSTPFSNGKGKGAQNFSSAEFIYGRIELPSSVEQFFKMPKLSKNDYPVSFLVYKISVSKDGEQLTSFEASWPYMKVAEEDRKNMYLDFDILPEPSVATTMMCGVTEFNAGIGSAPLYFQFDREHFPGDGEYEIGVRLSHWKYDPYNPGILLAEPDWISCEGKFTFTFSVDDLPSLLSNKQTAGELVKENARLKAMESRGLPEEWNWKSAPNGTGYTGQELISFFLAKEPSSCECLKLVLYPVTGPGWNVEKNHLHDPIQKWHNQTLGFFAVNNGRYFYIAGGLRQTYEGGGKYGETYFQWEKSVEFLEKFLEEASGSVKKVKSKATKKK